MDLEMRKLILTLAVMLAIVGLIVSPSVVPVVHARECTDDVMNACDRMWTTTMNQCLAGSNNFDACWAYARQRYSDCLRVNNCWNG